MLLHTFVIDSNRLQLHDYDYYKLGFDALLSGISIHWNLSRTRVLTGDLELKIYR